MDNIPCFFFLPLISPVVIFSVARQCEPAAQGNLEPAVLELLSLHLDSGLVHCLCRRDPRAHWRVLKLSPELRPGIPGRGLIRILVSPEKRLVSIKFCAGPNSFSVGLRVARNGLGAADLIRRLFLISLF